MSDLKTVKLAGEIFYAQDMTQFNTKFNPDNDKYICTVGQLSEAAVEALAGIGVKAKDHEAKGKHITAKSKFLFEPVDEQGNKVDPTTMGNGTQVIAILGSYAHKMSKMYGNAPSIKKLVVTKLVKYVPTENSSVPFDAAEEVL